MSELDDKPNIKRIFIALTEGGLVGKYTEDKCGIDLSEAFFQFIIEEEFEDEQIPEEFGDGALEESFFADWLTTTKELSESKAQSIWTDLNLANKGIYDPVEQKQNIDEDFTALYRNYNISIRDKDLQFIKQQLKVQCCALMPQGSSNNTKLDKATYAIIQIGKQNNNQPLLMYLVDAFNRYRIQKRRQVLSKLISDGYNEKEIATLFDQKYKVCEAGKFVQKKCTGIYKWLDEYSEKKQKQFIEMCGAAITVFPRRLLHKPPIMHPRIALINDSSIKICEYIFQIYQFIEEFMQQKNYAPLPTQIDIIIIPKKYKLINIDDDDDSDNDDEKDNTENNEHKYANIGDINNRLKNINNKINPIEIESGTANRTLLQAGNTLLKGKRNQRIIFIIDRRYKSDKCYGYQPNVNEDDVTKRCDCFESNSNNLINESLIQNLRLCLLPKINKEKDNITVNTQAAFGLIFSFQCFSQNEIRIYLCNNGWGTRFFIEDIKYFLPMFFVDEQKKQLKKEFDKKDKLFQDKYIKCKDKCVDKKFEIFYQSLFDDDKHKSH